MTPEEIQALQEKATELEKIKQSNRDRANRYLSKRREAGKKQISAILHIDAYEEINRRRDRSILINDPLTAGQIIEQALMATKDFIRIDGQIDIDQISDMAEIYDKYLLSTNININDNTTEDSININDNTTEDIEDPQIDIDQIFKEIFAKYPSNIQRAEALNQICKRPKHLTGEQWTPQNVKSYKQALVRREKRATQDPQ